MASKKGSVPAKHLFNGFHKYYQPRQSVRCMATEIKIPNATLSQAYQDAHLTSAPTQPVLEDDASSISRTIHQQPYLQPFQNPFLSTTQCTLHSFPSMEPTTLISYPSTHLLVPMRKDILHRAVIFEGDATRSGTANTLYRTEVHGSGRKIRPQKGTGRARLGDKKSPMLRGGGVAFGPKPRDFSTDLPQRIYDLAWRIALSHRYRLGQLILLENAATLDHVDLHSRPRYLKELLEHNHMGHGDGRTLFVTQHKRKSLFNALEEDRMGRHAAAKDVEDVDVKDLLEMGRLVVEKRALDTIFARHQSDLDNRMKLDSQRARGLPGLTAESSTV